MSLKRNIVANYVSQIYNIVISIVTLPMLLKYIGAEAYGLVGFFSLLQSVLSLLDLGMSQTFSREISRFRGGAITNIQLILLYKRLRKTFVILGLVFLITGICSTQLIAMYWLKAEQLSLSTVCWSVVMIVVVVAFRWFSGFYRALITGYEDLLWLSVCNSIVGTFRFVLVFIPLLYLNATPEVFFGFQLLLACVEFIVLTWKGKKLLPLISTDDLVQDSGYLKDAMRFALTIAFTTGVWVAVTQTDKLILSNMLALSEFGYYTLAIQLAGGITLISGPISSAIIPRMAKLEAEGKHVEMIEVYRHSTQLIVTLVGGIALVILFFARDILYLWSGDTNVVEHAYLYLILYAVGNLLLAVSAFPYYLQYAKGNLRYHVRGNIGFLVLLIPTLIWVVSYYGGVGAGYVWAIMNAVYFLCWVPLVHRYFDKTLHSAWLWNDVLKIILPMVLVGYAFQLVIPALTNRIEGMIWISLVTMVVIITGSLCSSFLRAKINGSLRFILEKK